MKTKRIVSGIFILALALCTLSFASAYTTYQDTPYGLVKIDIEKPGLFSTLFASFLKTTVYNGEQVEIYDGVAILGSSNCGVREWYICVYKDGASCVYGGNLASGAENIGGCNFDLYVSWVTNEPGNYNLRSKLKSNSATSYSYSDGDNTLTVLEQTPTEDCEWQGWTLWKSITHGYIKFNENKDLDLFDNTDCPGTEYKTYCDDGYHATGTSDGTRIANGALLCIADSGSGLQTCAQQGGVSVNSMDECNPGTMVDASNTPFCCVRGDDGGNGDGDGNGNGNGNGGVGKTLTYTEFYSLSDTDFLDKALVCNSDSSCPAIGGSTSKCLKTTETSKAIYNSYKSQCASFNFGIITGFPNLISRIITGDTTCGLATRLTLAIKNLAVGEPGLCVAESNSSFGKVWDQTLKMVAGLGLPRNYVMITTIIVIALLLFLLLGAVRR
jgi:hypothetical protein